MLRVEDLISRVPHGFALEDNEDPQMQRHVASLQRPHRTSPLPQPLQGCHESVRFASESSVADEYEECDIQLL
jgi:hypothetical protein